MIDKETPKPKESDAASQKKDGDLEGNKADQ
jgi:hypothetical protein